MIMRHVGYYQSQFGVIKYVYEKMKIYEVSFVFDDVDLSVFDDQINQSFDRYFQGKVTSFDYDFVIENKTYFQREVYKVLQNIPYGKTFTYGDIAKLLGRPNAARAVGQACKSNPIGIMIPCHRVIGKNKQMTGYRGKDYIFLKEKLLKLEQNFNE